MKIVVCIKQVVDPEAQLTVDPRTDSIDDRYLNYCLNPLDMYAVEEALRIKDRFGDSEVIVLTMGPPRTRKSLVECLTMGADVAIHLWDNAFERSDNHVTSVILAKAIALAGYDLVLCGRQAADDNCQQVPAAIAELLNLPYVSAVTKIDFNPKDKKVIAYSCLEKGDRELVECNLPAVFSLERGINRPRYPRQHSRMVALRKEISLWGCHTLGLSSSEVGQSGSMIELLNINYHRPRTKKASAPDTGLSRQERIKWLMQGGMVTTKSNLLQGSPEDVASRAVQFLVDEKIISAQSLKR